MSTILEVKDLEKSFGGVPVLRGVSFQIEPGQVVALAGENGAGKSTLFKIITGQIRQDEGSVLVGGTTHAKLDPRMARDLGVAIVPQELATYPEMMVYENLFVGRELKSSIGILDRPAMIRQATAMLEVFEINLNPKTKMGTLSTALAQIIEIIKATTANAQVILLDEPTSSIPDQEVELLYRIVRQLRSNGVAMLYTTHRMSEIQELADRVIVMRDGQVVMDADIAHAPEREIITAMIGRDLKDLFPAKGIPKVDVMLAVSSLTIGRHHPGVSLEVHSGEILGLGGLVGAGRTEIVEAIFGVRRSYTGNILVAGKDVTRNSPTASIDAGLAIVPEDRKGSGLVLSRSVLDNGTLPHLKSLSTAGILRGRFRRKIVGDSMESVALKARSLDQLVGTLSGGNQQKVVIARWLGHDTKVLLLDEPTRGVDVGARGEIYNIIRELADSGLAVLLVSSDMPELIGLSNRVMVIRDQQIAGELSQSDLAKSDVQEKIFRYASGLDSQKVA
ncbi:MAG: sugar ABC transporter ATP-binding protein [Actinomycetales bacterium]|nr:sugar ABC transporter ATP-binding protein [Actinomycetales bacterium]